MVAGTYPSVRVIFALRVMSMLPKIFASDFPGHQEKQKGSGKPMCSSNPWDRSQFMCLYCNEWASVEDSQEIGLDTVCESCFSDWLATRDDYNSDNDNEDTDMDALCGGRGLL